MGIVVLPKTLTAHTTAKAADVMADLNKLVEVVNGNIDRENIKDGEVVTSKLPDGAVTSPKFKPTAGALSLGADVSGKGETIGGEVFDLAGMEAPVTPAVKSTLFVFFSAWFFHVSSGYPVSVQIWVDGVAVGLPAGIGEESNTYPTGVVAVNLEPGAHTVKLRGNGNKFTSVRKGTQFSYFLVSR